MQSFFKFSLNISVSLPSSLLFLYTGSSCFAPAGGPRIENPKCIRFSSFLSISLFLLPPLSSLYILVAPVLLQQVVPEQKIQNAIVFQVSFQYLCFSSLLPARINAAMAPAQHTQRSCDRYESFKPNFWQVTEYRVPSNNTYATPQTRGTPAPVPHRRCARAQPPSA